MGGRVPHLFLFLMNSGKEEQEKQLQKLEELVNNAEKQVGV